MVRDIIWKVDSHLACQKYPDFFTEPEGSLPCSPALDQPSPVRPIGPCVPNVQFNVILPPTSRSSQWSLTFGLPNQSPVGASPLPHACHMSRPPRPPCFGHPNSIRWGIQIVKFIIMQFSPRPVYLPFGSKYSQYSLLKNPQSMLPPQSERPAFAPVQCSWRDYSFAYFNL
jgi:hypothetical protein